jgi:hypothetical protein
MKKLGYSEKNGVFERPGDEVRLAVRKDNSQVVVMLLRFSRPK